MSDRGDVPDGTLGGPPLGGAGARGGPAVDRARGDGRRDDLAPALNLGDDSSPGFEGSGLSLRARISVALLVAALAPLSIFGVLLIVGGTADDPGVLRLLLVALVVAVAVGTAIGYVVAGSLTSPLRALASALDRAAAGEQATRLPVAADDELGRLVERQNALASDLGRRNRQLAAVLGAVSTYSPRDGADRLVDLAVDDARGTFGMLDAKIVLGDPAALPPIDRVPGDQIPVRAALRAGGEPLGVLTGRVPATARWERADQDLLDLFATIVAVGLRNAELFARVEDQNRRLVELDAAKDDFLRGVSHNLKTPLARIRAYADQLAAETPDRRPLIIAEQSERLSRMVGQLLTVSRVDLGVVHPVPEVFALGPRVRRAWEALGATGVAFDVADGGAGWLVAADPDQVDQVVWALLDNAVKHGRGEPIQVTLSVDEAASRVRLTIADAGPGVTAADREALFGRFARGSTDEDGTGLGLYVARALSRANHGDLVLEPPDPARPGAAFALILPAESPMDS